MGRQVVIRFDKDTFHVSDVFTICANPLSAFLYWNSVVWDIAFGFDNVGLTWISGIANGRRSIGKFRVCVNGE